MAEIDFFTSPDLLISQTSDLAYGAVTGSEQSKYRLTSKFRTTSPAKAYAATSGTIFIQPVTGNDDLINLALKPSVGDFENGFTEVEYFIYRGLKKENFVTGANDIIIPYHDTFSTDLTNGIWEDFEELKSRDTTILATAPSNSSLGFDKITNDLLSSVFYNDDNLYQMAGVTAGMYIGVFEGSIQNPGGFEILLKDHLYFPTIDLLRASENIISVMLPGAGDIPGNEGLSTMREREKILNYIDPSAYFMLFSEGTINAKLSDGTTTKYSNLADIYNNIVSNFYTKNILYIDIRNENNYSLNYYKDNEGTTSDTDYGKHLQLSFDEGISYTATNYYTNFWPILSITPPINHSTSNNKVYIKFRNNYNPSPLIYLDFGQRLKIENNTEKLYFPQNSRKFIDEPFTVPLPVSWSNKFKLYSPNITSLSTKTQPSWFIKLHNIRKVKPSLVGLPASAISRDTFIDNVFGPVIDSDLIELFGTGKTQWVAFSGKRYIDAYRSEIGVAGMFDILIAISVDSILFYASMSDYYIPQESEETQLIVKEYFVPHLIGIGSSKDTNLIRGIEKGAGNLQFEFKKEERTVGLTTRKIHAVTFPDDSEKHNYIATLLLSRAEYDFLVNSSSALNSEYHEVLIQFSPFTTFLDDNSNPFQQATLHLVGYDNSGTKTVIPTNMVIQSIQDLKFNSITAVENLQLPDIEVTPFSRDELIQQVQRVEAVYRIKINANGSPLDNTPDKTVTRIRVHYYGHPGKEELGIAFNKGVPFAPYLEPISTNSNCTSDAIPPAFEFATSAFGCRVRKLYEKSQQFGEELGFDLSFTLIKTKPLLFHNNLIIDYGHAFYGLCALLHPGTGNNQGKPHPIYQNGFAINNSIDFTSFVGDLASAISEAYNIHYIENGDHNVPFSLLDSYYSTWASNADILGDIDIFGLKYTWDYFISQGTAFNFSDVLAYYYSDSVPAPVNHLILHSSKRFSLFALYHNFIDNQGNWVLNTNSNEYADFRSRIRKFCKFYHSKFQPSPKYKTGACLYLDFSTLNTSSYFNSFQDYHIEYVLDKFLSYFQTGYHNE